MTEDEWVQYLAYLEDGADVSAGAPDALIRRPSVTEWFVRWLLRH